MTATTVGALPATPFQQPTPICNETPHIWQTSTANGQTRRSAPTHMGMPTDHRGDRIGGVAGNAPTPQRDVAKSAIGVTANAVPCVGADLRVCPVCHDV